jgi:hypothetical protein
MSNQFGGYRSAEEQWKAEHRKLSPRYPDNHRIMSEYRSRQKQRETIAARTFGIGILLGLLYAAVGSVVPALQPSHGFGWWVVLFSFVGFVVTCFVAGGRASDYNGY